MEEEKGGKEADGGKDPPDGPEERGVVGSGDDEGRECKIIRRESPKGLAGEGQAGQQGQGSDNGGAAFHRETIPQARAEDRPHRQVNRFLWGIVLESRIDGAGGGA